LRLCVLLLLGVLLRLGVRALLTLFLRVSRSESDQ
jgi:hypothetical protein